MLNLPRPAAFTLKFGSEEDRASTVTALSIAQHSSPDQSESADAEESSDRSADAEHSSPDQSSSRDRSADAEESDGDDDDDDPSAWCAVRSIKYVGSKGPNTVEFEAKAPKKGEIIFQVCWEGFPEESEDTFHRVEDLPPECIEQFCDSSGRYYECGA